jgi:hypothetical protein
MKVLRDGRRRKTKDFLEWKKLQGADGGVRFHDINRCFVENIDKNRKKTSRKLRTVSFFNKNQTKNLFYLTARRNFSTLMAILKNV